MHGDVLSPPQRALLNVLRAEGDASSSRTRYQLVRYGRKHYAKSGRTEFPLPCTDQDLMDLARLEYIRLYSAPPAIEPTSKLWQVSSVEHVSEPVPTDPSAQVLRLDISQVYAWLAASLLAAIIALLLLALTAYHVLSGHASTGVASTVATLISSVLSLAFFRQYDHANQRLQDLRHNAETRRRSGR